MQLTDVPSPWLSRSFSPSSYLSDPVARVVVAPVAVAPRATAAAIVSVVAVVAVAPVVPLVSVAAVAAVVPATVAAALRLSLVSPMLHQFWGWPSWLTLRSARISSRLTSMLAVIVGGG